MNLYTNKKNFLWQKVISGTVILAASILLLNVYQAPIKNYFFAITSPITKTFWTAGDGSSGLLASVFSFGSLTKENKELAYENQALLARLSLLQSELAKTQAVQGALDATKHDNFTLVLAEAIGLDTANDFILINKGRDDGIQENMPVISAEKILYGKVVIVYANFSRVMLISNKTSVMDIKILAPVDAVGEPGTPALGPIYGAVKGSGNLSMYLDLISSDVKLHEGDVLVSSALEGAFPKDLLVGKIVSTNQNDLKPFQTAEVQPFFDIKKIEALFVITNYMQK
ncbi:MAG: rod shape-determining protein MreC [bacterium]|nr:rod shape-determining protein MreC [bacterium]